MTRRKGVPLIVLLLAVIVAAGAWHVRAASLPEKVALVNGVPITVQQLEREVRRLEGRNSFDDTVNSPGREHDARPEALNNLIERELLYQESRRQGISVPAEVVERDVASLKKSVTSSLELERSLDELNISDADLRRELEQGIAARTMLLKRFASTIEPSESEMRRYFDRNPKLFNVPEQVRVSHILVKMEHRWLQPEQEAARRRIEEIAARLRNNGDFAAVAREMSDCLSRNSGGDLGWFRRGQLAQQLEAQLFQLPAGTVSDVVEDRYGYHIFLVTGKRAPRSVDFNEARGKIADYLRQESLRHRAKALADELRKAGRVELFLRDSWKQEGASR